MDYEHVFIPDSREIGITEEGNGYEICIRCLLKKENIGVTTVNCNPQNILASEDRMALFITHHQW